MLKKPNTTHKLIIVQYWGDRYLCDFIHILFFVLQAEIILICYTGEVEEAIGIFEITNDMGLHIAYAICSPYSLHLFGEKKYSLEKDSQMQESCASAG